jgi:predicted nucleic acid-binding protein
LRIAAELDMYAYDAYLIRCGLKYNAPLISLDKALVSVAQKIGAKVIEVEQ